MALLWLEGGETFDTANGAIDSTFGRKYTVTTIGNVQIQDGRSGGKALKIASLAAFETIGALTSNATIIVGFGFKNDTLPSTTLTILQLKDGATDGMNVRLKSDGEFEVRRGNTLLATTSGAALGTGAWGYLEFKVLVNNSTGTYELRVNSNNEASDTGVDTQIGSNVFYDTVEFQSTQVGRDAYYDDIYIFDGSGSTNNDFVGSQKVEAIFPDAEGTTIDFTPSTGIDNSALVDEQPPNDDTDYVESGTVTDKDTYDYQSLPTISQNIKGLQINTDCRETDANPFSLITVARSGTTESDDGGQAIGSTSYVHRHRIVEQDPDTAAAWTDTGINAAEFGIKVA